MNGRRAPSPSGSRIAVAAGVWVVAMAMLLLGGIVGGTGRVVLTVASIVFLLLAVAYIGLQIWYLNRLQRGQDPGAADRPAAPRRPR